MGSELKCAVCGDPFVTTIGYNQKSDPDGEFIIECLVGKR